MLMLFLRRYIVLFGLITLLTSTVSCNQVQKRPTFEKGHRNGELSMPVSVYLMEFSNMKELNAQYTQKDVMELFSDVNAIWSKWGMRWHVDSVETVSVNENSFTVPSNGFSSPREFRNAVAKVIPDVAASRRWRVYLVKQFPVNGSAVYLAEKGAVLYGELNKNGERHPVVLAHEFGHSLRLQHVPLSDNLMYAGPGRDPELTKKLHPKQIKRAKQQASIGPALRSLKN